MVKACIKFEIKDRVNVKEVDINNQANVTPVSFPDNQWEDFTKATIMLENFQFSSGYIISYFVTPSVCDGLPAGDFKAINRSAENLFVGLLVGMLLQVFGVTTNKFTLSNYVVVY